MKYSDFVAAEKDYEGFLRAGLVLYSVTWAVSEEPDMLHGNFRE